MRTTLLALAGLCCGLLLVLQAARAADETTGPQVSAKAGASASSKPDAAAATTRPADAIVDRGGATPRELLETADKVLGGGKPNVNDVLGLCEPSYRRVMKMGVDMLGRLAAKQQELAGVIEDKIGKEQADKLRGSGVGGAMDQAAAGMAGPIAEAVTEYSKDGKIDWAKIKVSEDGDKATVDANGTAAGPLAKVDGKWYIAAPDGFDLLANTAAIGMQAGIFNKVIKGMDEIERKVKSGAITKDNLDQEANKIMSGAVGGGMGGVGG